MVGDTAVYELEEDEGISPAAVIGLAVAGIILGILVFLGFDYLWALRGGGTDPPWGSGSEPLLAAYGALTRSQRAALLAAAAAAPSLGPAASARRGTVGAVVALAEAAAAPARARCGCTWAAWGPSV